VLSSFNVWFRGQDAASKARATAEAQTLATMPFRVTRQILRENKITFDIPTYQASLRGQLVVSLDNVGLEKRKIKQGLDSADEQSLV